MHKKRSFYLFMMIAIGTFLILKRPKYISSDIKLPVNFPNHFLEPTVNVLIEGNKYDFLVDLGSTSYAFHLEDRILQKLSNKEALGDGKLCDIKGNVYTAPEFCIPEIKIGGQSIFNSIATKRNHQFLYNVQIGSEQNSQKLIEDKIIRIDGKVGLPLFKQYNCLFDFPNSAIILQKNIKNPEKNYTPSKFVHIPFSIENYGITLSIETDAGVHKMVLDTGATYSVINKKLIPPNQTKEIEQGLQKYFPTNQLIINGCNFGSWELALFDISDKFDLDGCLGADFFLEYAVYLDFQNKMAYIQKPEKIGLFTQWKRLKIRAKNLLKNMVQL